MKIRTSKPLLLVPILLALAACGNKGPLLPPPAPGAEEWPESAPEDAQADDVDGVPEARRDSGVDPDARLDDGDDAGDQEDAAAEDRVDGEGEDPVPGASAPATDGGR